MGEDLQRIGLTFDDAEMSKALLGISKGAEIERADFIKVLLKDGSPKKGTTGRIGIHRLILCGLADRGS